MTDITKAIAAAREALHEHDAYGMPIDAGTIRDLLAALDAAQGEAVAWPKADDSDKELGWSWDYKWLESLADATRAAGWDASMEAIDFVLSRVAAPQAPPAAVPAVRITPRDGKWVYGDNDEVFNSCDHETELSAVTDALDNYADAETIYVGQVKALDVRRMIRADYLLEIIGERAYDDVGEAAEHWPELSKDQQAELEGIIADYILSKSPADFNSVENVRVYTREQAEAMLAAANKENGNG